MSLLSPAWVRPQHQVTERIARVRFVALLDDPHIEDRLDELRAQMARDEVWRELDIEVRSSNNDTGWLDDNALYGRPRLALEALPDVDRVAAKRCRWYASIEAEVPDPAELVVLQAACAVVRGLAVTSELLYALDLGLARWRSREQLAAAAHLRAFDFDDHCLIAIEAREREPGAGYLVRSRGLDKLARPDVGARASHAATEWLSSAVRGIAVAMAEGRAFSPGEAVRISGLPAFTLIPRADDALTDAPADEAPLYEIRDLAADGAAAETCEQLVTALRPKRRLRLVE